MNTRTLAALALASTFAQPAAAGGLVVPGAGPHAQARAGAFTAKADDPSAISHNPAGFAKLDGTHIMLGANFVNYSLEYSRFGSYEPNGEPTADPFEGLAYPTVEDKSSPLGFGGFAMIPLLAVSTDLGRPDWPVRFGAGVFAPQGYVSRDFDDEYDLGVGAPAPAPQRYDVQDQNAIMVQPSLVVAYSPLPTLDIGARASWGFGSIEGKKTVWSIRNYEEFTGREAVFTLEGAKDNFVFGYSLGALFRPTPSIEIGAAYNSEQNVHAVGEGSSQVGPGVIDGLMTLPVPDDMAKCEKGGVPGAMKACFDLTIARNATVAARYIFRDADGGERADIELDVRWEDWSASKDNVITVDAQATIGQGSAIPFNQGLNRHGFRDVISVRLGGHYKIDIGDNAMQLRAGAAYDTAAAPDSWTRADLDGKERITIASGIAFEFGRYRLDIGGGVSLEPDITVEPCKAPNGPSVGDEGCSAAGETPGKERTAPDPQQPLRGKFVQIESPFNAGTYKSGYVLLSAALSAHF